MSVLRKSQRVLSGLKLIGNFVEKPLRAGDIVLNDDGQHLLWGNIEDVIDGFSLEGKLTVSNKADLKYISESNVKVTFGGEVNSPLLAKGQLQLEFNADNSAFVALKQIKRTSVKLGLINAELAKYWEEHGFNSSTNRKKYHFIADIIEAESGTVIFSHKKSNTVILSGKNNIPLTSFAEIGEGKIENISSTKSTLQIISETKIQPLYTAIRYRKDGNFDIVS